MTTDDYILLMLKTEVSEKSIKKLYNYFPPIQRFILKNGGSKDDAFDTFQDALLILINKIKTTDFQLTSSLSTYIFSICKYQWQISLNKQNRFHQFAQNFIENEFNVEQEEEKYINASKAFQLLGEKCKALLTAFYYQKLNMIQIADEFGYDSEKVAKNQKYKCLEKARLEYSKLTTSNQ